MTSRIRRRAASALLLGLGLIFVTGQSEGAPEYWKAVLPENVFAELVNRDAQVIRETLAKGTPDKKMAVRLRCSAAMIASYAQTQMLKGGSNAQQLAGLRDLALKVNAAVKDGKFDDAKKLTGELSPTAKGEANAKTTPVDLQKETELDIIMNQFKAERSAGLDIEKKFLALVKHRGKLSPEQYKEIVPMTYQMNIIGQYAEALAPERDEGPKKRADWVRWAQEMQRLTLEAAKAASAAKPDDKAVKDLLNKIDANCTSCHKVFRIDQ